MHPLSFHTNSFVICIFAWLCFYRDVQARASFSASHIIPRQYGTGESKINDKSETHHLEFFNFVTRPDIDAPRWNVRMYDRDAVQPGYWFTATYEYVEQKEYENSRWVGPHIYDQTGELVWSGAPLFKGYNVKDFRVSDVGGLPMLTGIYAREGVEVVVNSSYEIVEKVPVAKPQHVNIHGFNTVWNGTRSLAMTTMQGTASKEESQKVGYKGECHVSYPGFEERDTATWEATFNWTSQGHIRLEESRVHHSCKGTWDYLHANSIDKFPDGDYLYSGRHSDTLYKISGKDGSIVWRLGGKYSNFTFDDHFSGQHDARVREQNATHIVLSIMDNAIRPGLPHITNDQSRGMLIALRTDKVPMTAHALQKYNHPHASYAPGRGNFQLMENNNAFLAWWMRSLISENAPDGRLLMEASWIPELKSYRSYKFPWVGHPSQPPDVHARAVNWTDEASGLAEAVQTVVYVSWNGATEVDTWRLFKTTADGQSRESVRDVKRQGFETMMTYDGFASYVVVEALDRNGNSLGQSEIVRTIPPRSLFGPAVLQESHWLDEHSSPGRLTDKLLPAGNPVAAYIWGVLTCLAIMLLVRSVGKFKRKRNWRSWKTPCNVDDPLYEGLLDASEKEMASERNVPKGAEPCM